MSSSSQGEVVYTPQREARSAFPMAAILLVLGVGVLLPMALARGLTTNSELKVVALELCLLGTLAVLLQPFWGLVLVVGLLYVRPEESIAALAGMRFTLLVSLVALASVLAHLFLSREKLVRTPFNVMLLGFAATAILSTVPNWNMAEAVLEISKLVILVLLVLNLVRTPQRYRAFVTTLLVFTAYLALYSIYLYFTGGAMQQGELARSQATGIFSDPNDLAATVAAGLALALVRARNARGLMRLVYLLLAGSQVWAVVLTYSRSGLLSLLLVICGFLICSMRRKAISTVLAVGLGILLFVVAPSRMTDFDRSEASANQRFWLWSDGLQQLYGRPLTGIGYGQFPEINGGWTAHNSFVLCFTELGLPGYFFWMGCLYYCFKRRVPKATPEEESEEEKRDLVGARLALSGFLFSGFWLSRTYVPVLYLLMCLPVAAQIAARGRPGPQQVKGAEWLRDCGRIGLISLGSILLIQLMTDFLK
ncbi:MAG: O-antigen ligase family protein [Armatimonadetes bacterium]|nr:O-antigen ligase family protein [Armatimonadota bacterium]